MAPRLHNEIPDKFGGAINASALANYVRRVSEVMEAQQALSKDIAGICAEADEAGVASKRELRRLARESLMEPDVLQAQLERMADLRRALGEFEATPLGSAAVMREQNGFANPQVKMPAKKFAEQPVTPKRARGRPPKAKAQSVDKALGVDEALAASRLHLGGDVDNGPH